MSYLEEEAQRAASAGRRAYSDLLPSYAEPGFGRRQRFRGGRLGSNWRADDSLVRIERSEPEILEILQRKLRLMKQFDC